MTADHEVVTEIEDTGPGIAPEIAGQLFEVFATYGKAHGTGLGLSICKRIIRGSSRPDLGRATSRGAGAVFSFGLPRADGRKRLNSCTVAWVTWFMSCMLPRPQAALQGLLR